MKKARGELAGVRARFLLRDGNTLSAWAPFALTKPIGELAFGRESLRRRAERVLGLECEGYIVEPGVGRAHLVGTSGGRRPAVLDEARTCESRPTLVLSAQVALDGVAGGVGALAKLLDRQQPAVLTVNDSVAGWITPPGQAPAGPPPASVTVELAGVLYGHPWELVAANTSRLSVDLKSDPRLGCQTESTGPRRPLAPGDGASLGSERDCMVLGNGPIWIAPGARVEPGVVLDTRRGGIGVGYGARIESGARVVGPAVLGPGVTVRCHARLVGPLSVGGGSVLLGGEIGLSTIGRRCRIRGELSHSIVGNYVNKAHDGYIGHSFIGDWVNLGAGTTNSDLKNSYTPVRINQASGRMETNLLKLGCLVGDFVRTGIGTLMGAGSVVGAGSNVFGGGMAPAHVTPFSWWGGGGGDGSRGMEMGGRAAEERYRISDFVKSLGRVMERRGRELSPGLESVIRQAWQRTAPLAMPSTHATPGSDTRRRDPRSN